MPRSNGLITCRADFIPVWQAQTGRTDRRAGAIQPQPYLTPDHPRDRRREPFRSCLGGFVRYTPVLSIDQYAQLLFDCGAEDILAFEKVRPRSAISDAVVEWISGTVCVPYFERLGGHKDEFVMAI